VGIATMLASLAGLCSSERAERRRPVREDTHDFQGSPHRRHHTVEALPFVRNAERWQTLQNGNEAAVCDACFPQSVTAPDLCLPECIFPPSDILEVHQHIVEGKVAPEGQPWFIIGYGPPASGKAGIVTALERLSAFGVTPRNTIVTEVDGLFQNTLRVGRRFRAQQAQLSMLSEATQEREQAAGRLYTAYRFVADQISDAVLWKATAKRMNVYYETTGWSIGWTNHMIEQMRGLGYRTVVVYPATRTATLLRRLHDRAEKSGRIPKPYEGVLQTVEAAVANLEQLRLRPAADALLVLDNNGQQAEEVSYGPYFNASEAQAAVLTILSGGTPARAATLVETNVPARVSAPCWLVDKAQNFC